MNKQIINEKIKLRDSKEEHSSRSTQEKDDGRIVMEKEERIERSGNQHETFRRFVVTCTNVQTIDVLLPNTREYQCDTTHLDEPYRHAAPVAVTDSFSRFSHMRLITGMCSSHCE